MNRLQKVLEGANIKIASVVSDVLGVSTRAMLEGLLEDPVDPEVLDQLARGRMKNKTKNLERALTGLMGSPAADACHSA